VEELKYLGTTLTNQNSIQEEIKSSLKSESSVFQFAFQNFKDTHKAIGTYTYTQRYTYKQKYTYI